MPCFVHLTFSNKLDEKINIVIIEILTEEQIAAIIR